jgi:transposase
LKQNSRRWVQISHREKKQVDHLLHIITSHLVSECVKKGVKEIAIGDLNGIREKTLTPTIPSVNVCTIGLIEK